MTSPRRPRVALFGFPLGHTVSPAMHHAAATELELPLEYLPWPIDATALPAAVEALRGADWLGANVTLPHKPAMLRLVDGVTPLVERIGALNTVFKREGRLLGENTDAPAFVRALSEELDFQPAHERVIVLGAGGAARAVVVALAQAGVGSLAIWNRTPARAAQLVAEVASRSDAAAPVPTPVDEGALQTALLGATLVVNATSAGLDGAASPLTDLELAPASRVYDLVYGAHSTPLVRLARAQGVRAADGLWMLVYQAAAAFELWLGVSPSEPTMYRAAVAELQARAASMATVREVDGAGA